MKDQVEERLWFFSTGEKPRTNVEVMKEVLEELKQEGLYWDNNTKTEKKRDKKKKAKEEEQDESEDEAPKKKKKEKKEKKEKKHKRAKEDDE